MTKEWESTKPKLIFIPVKIEAQTRFSLPLSAAEQPPNEVRFAAGEHTEETTHNLSRVAEMMVEIAR